MTDIVPVTSERHDFSGMGLTQSKTGHVHSPWWSYPWRSYQSGAPATAGSYFHGIRLQSIAAFAGVLGIPENEIICSQRTNKDGDFEWRLGTQFPCKLPMTQKLIEAKRAKLNAGLPAIDI